MGKLEDKKKDNFSAPTPASEKLVNLIEHNADELTTNWLQDVCKDECTPTYHNFDKLKLYERAFEVFSQLGRWISRETAKEEIAQHYISLGAQRREEGFPLSEVIHALILVRRHLWRKVLGEGLLDTMLDLYQAIELNNCVMLFFDRAIYYITIGYQKKG
jgi:hypothetical protein